MNNSKYITILLHHGLVNFFIKDSFNLFESVKHKIMFIILNDIVYTVVWIPLEIVLNISTNSDESSSVSKHEIKI